MAATREAYRPPQVSERDISHFNTCTIVSTLTGVMGAMLGENVTWPNGAPYGRNALRSLVRQARDATGDPERAGYGRAHLNTFFRQWKVPIREKAVRFTRNRDDIVDALGKDCIIAMAGDVRGCVPGSPLRDHVNEVAHRMAFMDLRRRDGVQQTRMYDPMTPLGHSNWGRWVPVQDMIDFGKRFRHWGRFLAERYRKGHETKAALVRRNMADLNLQIQTKLAEAIAGWRAADEEVDDLVKKYNALDAKHTELLENSGVSATVEKEVRARLVEALTKLDPDT